MSETRELGRYLRKGFKVSKEDTKKLKKSRLGKVLKGKNMVQNLGEMMPLLSPIDMH